MTRTTGEKVTLERRDWVAVATFALAVFAGVGGLFLHLDRSMVEIQTCQRTTATRLERIEGDILRLEARLLDHRNAR